MILRLARLGLRSGGGGSPFARCQKLSSDNKAAAPTVDGEAQPAAVEAEEEPLWKDPFKHALPKQEKTYTDFREVKVDWSYVERLLPRRIIPDMPKDVEVTPSGWRPPRDPIPDLPYYIRRQPSHMPAIFLEMRRDELNPKTMDFEHVEIVLLRQITGDIFACERDLREFLEAKAGHPVATHVDELKGLIRVKGVDRTLVERFFYDSGF